MRRKLRFGVLAAGALVAGSLGAGLASTATAGSPSPQSADEGMTIAVVTHGQAADPFWSVFKRGVDDAAAQMGATANYSAPATFDMTEMSSLIDAAVATNPDGLVVSVPDYPALQDSLAAASEAGIPIITVNAGSEHYQDIGAITHIGQDETSLAVGRVHGLPRAGPHTCCASTTSRATLLSTRIARRRGGDGGGGWHDGHRPGRPQRRRGHHQHRQRDPAGRRYDRRDPCARANSVDTCDGGIRRARSLGQMPIATFDLSPDVIQAIIDGNMTFAIDQQQYLQGYLPIVFLKLYHDNLNTVGGGLPVYTGPGFVTADNAEQVLELTGEGSR